MGRHKQSGVWGTRALSRRQAGATGITAIELDGQLLQAQAAMMKLGELRRSAFTGATLELPYEVKASEIKLAGAGASSASADRRARSAK